MYQACADGYLDKVQLLFREGDREQLQGGFFAACAFGHLHVAKWLHNVDCPQSLQHGFDVACAYGQLHVAKWIHEICDNDNLFIDHAFTRACRCGDTEVAQWILSIVADRSPAICDRICSRGYHQTIAARELDTAEWLYDTVRGRVVLAGDIVDSRWLRVVYWL